MGIQEMDQLQSRNGSQAQRIQKKVIGSSKYDTSQICICNFCGSKIVSNNGSCDQICGRCGSQMQDHSGVKRMGQSHADAYGYDH